MHAQNRACYNQRKFNHDRSKNVKLSSNQRKHLEALANPMDAIIRIGKQGLEAKIVSSVIEAFNSHELIKIKLLDTSPVDVEEVVDEILDSTDAALVRTIGRVIILYRPFTDKPTKIELPAPR